MKIVFTTSKELNGTALLRDNLQSLDPEWRAVKSYKDMLIKVLFEAKKIDVIYCLSDIHCIFSHAVCKLFGVKIPIVLGYYHPEQWHGTMDRNVSKTRAKSILKIIQKIPPENIVFSSRGGSSVAASYIGNRCQFERLALNIVPGPVVQEINAERNKNGRINKPLKIVTIDRFVPFKISTVLAMIDVVDGLITEGYDIIYSIYGDGPSEGVVAAKIRNAIHPENFKIGGYVSDADYEKICLSHDVFYGMGGAVVRAAMLGMPSLIAIQRCEERKCFGLVSSHDHFARPIFGDDEPGIEKLDLKNEVINLYTHDDLLDIGMKCREASSAYGISETINKLNSIVESAKFYDPNISILDVLRIRLELIYSRLMKIKERDL